MPCSDLVAVPGPCSDIKIDVVQTGHCPDQKNVHSHQEIGDKFVAGASACEKVYTAGTVKTCSD